MIDRLAAALRTESPVTDVAGVSSARAAALSRLGVRSVRDLLTHYPSRYIDMSSLQSIASAPVGRPATVVARVHEVTIGDFGTKAVVSYHPSYLLRAPD